MARSATAVAAVAIAVTLVATSVWASGTAEGHAAGGADSLGRGFGDAYAWHRLADGLDKVRADGKPGMIVVHKSWCGACKRLGPQFAKDPEVQRLASSFVMINVHDDEEPDGAEYQPDGGYIPRILFTDAEGRVRPDLFNADGSPQYKYFYPEPRVVASGMQRALDTLAAEAKAAAKSAGAEDGTVRPAGGKLVDHPHEDLGHADADADAHADM